MCSRISSRVKDVFSCHECVLVYIVVDVFSSHGKYYRVVDVFSYRDDGCVLAVSWMRYILSWMYYSRVMAADVLRSCRECVLVSWKYSRAMDVFSCRA